jgi:uncharacterized membrane protein YeaQ/YmgE (transglycosylase-associated protein family)
VAGLLMGSQGTITRIEDVLVGVFGAFAGGDFLLSVLSGPSYKAAFFSMPSLGMAIAGAAVMLVLLRIMRGVVGPMRASKRRQAKRI